jgi:hypothetical protein
MLPLVWLAIAVAAGAGAVTVASPAWSAYRGRDARDTNSERYLAWRGRASRGPRPRERLTANERRRLIIGAVLALVALGALVAFFVTS